MEANIKLWFNNSLFPVELELPYYNKEVKTNRFKVWELKPNEISIVFIFSILFFIFWFTRFVTWTRRVLKAYSTNAWKLNNKKNKLKLYKLLYEILVNSIVKCFNGWEVNQMFVLYHSLILQSYKQANLNIWE